jgi:aryl-alcohol dehydrogenase-like predicted oxidoreductase
VPRAQIALAWVLQKSEVTAPIVGATRLEQLDDAVAALSISLTEEEIKAVEAPYVPHAVTGHA